MEVTIITPLFEVSHVTVLVRVNVQLQFQWYQSAFFSKDSLLHAVHKCDKALPSMRNSWWGLFSGMILANENGWAGSLNYFLFIHGNLT